MPQRRRRCPRTMLHGTVLTPAGLPATLRAHPEGPPSMYKWRHHHVDSGEELRRVHSIAGAMSVAIMEVITGARSSHQLARWVHRDVMAKVELRAFIESAKKKTPPRPVEESGRFDPKGFRPRRVRAIPVGRGEYEAGVVVDDGDRSRALALRIHKTKGQWQIMDAEIG